MPLATSSQSRRFQVSDDPTLISSGEVCALLSCCRMTLWRLRRDPTFPPSVQLRGPNSPHRWQRAAVLQWLARQAVAEPVMRKPERPEHAHKPKRKPKQRRHRPIILQLPDGREVKPKDMLAKPKQRRRQRRRQRR